MYDDIISGLSVKAVVDFTPADVQLALTCIKKRIPYLGICLTSIHQQSLQARLESEVMKLALQEACRDLGIDDVNLASVVGGTAAKPSDKRSRKTQDEPASELNGKSIPKSVPKAKANGEAKAKGKSKGKAKAKTHPVSDDSKELADLLQSMQKGETLDEAGDAHEDEDREGEEEEEEEEEDEE